MAIKYRINGRTVSQQELRASADPNRLRDVFLSRQFPGINDDTVFMANRGSLLQQVGPDMINEVVATAKAHGYIPSTNDGYLPELADFPGDPKAFIKQDGAQAHVRKVCEEKGVRCEGMVKVRDNPELREMTKEKRIPLGDDLCQEWAVEAMKKDPKLANCSIKEGRVEAAKVHGRLSDE